eukprot:scaffold7912_cov104-Skeletonema_dohrnii-CCMP3373.AAC.3
MEIGYKITRRLVLLYRNLLLQPLATIQPNYIPHMTWNRHIHTQQYLSKRPGTSVVNHGLRRRRHRRRQQLQIAAAPKKVEEEQTDHHNDAASKYCSDSEEETRWVPRKDSIQANYQHCGDIMHIVSESKPTPG